MKRIYAAGVLAILTALVVALTCLAPRGGALTGSWEIEVGEYPYGGWHPEWQPWALRYTFCDDGTYTCEAVYGGTNLADGAQLRGNYLVRGNKLYMSEGLDYKIDPDVYDLYRLEGDTLTLLENSTGAPSLYPLALTRVTEG